MSLRLLAPLTLCALPLVSSAQLIERNEQISWNSSYDRMIRWNDSLWAFAGNVNHLNTFNSNTQVLVMDTMGAVHWQQAINVGLNETVSCHALASIGGDTLLVGGLTWEICDVGGDYAWLVALDINGDTLWSAIYGEWDIEHLATPGDHILASRLDQVMVLDELGDSLTAVQTGSGQILRMRTDGDQVLMSCMGGLLVTDENGGLLMSRSMGPVRDLIRYNDSTYACLTADHLFLLDDSLLTIDSVVYGAAGQGRMIDEDLTYLWVIGADSLRFFDPFLQPYVQLPTNAPAGWQLRDAVVGTDVVMTAGQFLDGTNPILDDPAWTAVVRSVGKHGEVVELFEDAALGGVGADNITFTDAGGGFYNVSAVIRVWLRNDGSDLLNSVFLNHLDGYGICSPYGVVNQYGSIGLAPGDSVYASAGMVYMQVFSPDGTPVDVEFCLRVSTPNGYMDRDTTDDHSCGSITIPIGIEEFSVDDDPLIWPVPTTGALHVLLPPGVHAGTAYMILDQQGRCALQGRIDENATIGTDPLAPGAYLLQLKTEDRGWRVPFIRATDH